ncbi:prepilin-type N-terminal cleavage/methylation domain-containing protein [Bacillus sp. FJAT-49736]|uniref:type IV pilus modification PilV family protein n=1 Tax=Bacillus sp. FJAT-49736 TaxID=2833582 RepID=UPI001BC982C9|nr:prepilin-type N-terminal cleavage/methylation domain-containing protein [Bacillus sp. FJAT-49736]MBS4173714.1 prepilin-type N-terminal cleavage/methylation domain-containing protein [Bacillus sp. FJAT-49736]
MKAIKLLRKQEGLTLIEVLLSITILSIILFSFMRFFLQAGNFTNLNEKKTVAVNVARNVLMFMKQQSFIEIKDKIAKLPEENGHFNLYICDNKYQYFNNTETPLTSCKSIQINNEDYKVSLYSNLEDCKAEGNCNYYIPITVEVRWSIRDKIYKTTIDGTIESEDLR